MSATDKLAFPASDIEVRWKKIPGPNFNQDIEDWRHMLIGHLEFHAVLEISRMDSWNKNVCTDSEARVRRMIWDKMYAPLHQHLMKLRDDCLMSAEQVHFDGIYKKWGEVLKQLEEARTP